MAERGTFDFSLLANFVHQVINPLNGVSGTLGNLIDGTIVEEHRRIQRLGAARAQLEHAIMLVRNLAYFSQISLDSQNTNPGQINKICVIPQIIIEAAMFFQEMAKSKGCSIDLIDKKTQYRVQGNPDLLRQVFMNMFDNAVKYSNPNTQIIISPRIQAKTNSLIVEITNIGAPIPFSDREKVFDLGYRASSAKVKVASGTGLGLHIGRTIMRSVHGGDITLETDERAGRSSFFLRFPQWDITQ